MLLIHSDTPISAYKEELLRNAISHPEEEAVKEGAASMAGSASAMPPASPPSSPSPQPQELDEDGDDDWHISSPQENVVITLFLFHFGAILFF